MAFKERTYMPKKPESTEASQALVQRSAAALYPLVPDIPSFVKAVDGAIENARSACPIEQVNQLVASAEGLTVQSAEQAEVVNEELREIKRLQNAVEGAFTPLIDPWHQLHKCVLDIARPYRDGLSKAEKARKGAISRWLDQEEERKRIAAEQAARAIEQAQQQAQKQADDLMARGKIAQAREMLQAANTPMVPIVAEAPVKLEGSRTSVKYTAVVEDFKALVLAVAQGQVPIEALLPNQRWLDNEADTVKEAFRVPGCSLTKERRLATRAAD
jgi:hypothetical protein